MGYACSGSGQAAVDRWRPAWFSMYESVSIFGFRSLVDGGRVAVAETLRFWCRSCRDESVMAAVHRQTHGSERLVGGLV